MKTRGRANRTGEPLCNCIVECAHRIHIQDLDGVGLITPEIEAGLSEPLRQRLAEVRASD